MPTTGSMNPKQTNKQMEVRPQRTAKPTKAGANTTDDDPGMLIMRDHLVIRGTVHTKDSSRKS